MRHIKYLFLFIMPFAFAHPHMWIDVAVTPLTNTQGEIHALQQRWQFDPFFSGVFVQDMARLPDEERADYWQQLQEDTLSTLQDAHFYTHPQAAFTEAQDVRFYVGDAEVLMLELRLPLKTPAKTLDYQLYEPSYYAEMLHSREQAREIDACRLTLQAGEPSKEMMAQAAALDREDKPDIELGQWFAERARWVCS